MLWSDRELPRGESALWAVSAHQPDPCGSELCPCGFWSGNIWNLTRFLCQQNHNTQACSHQSPFTQASHFTMIGAALQSSGSEFCDSVSFRENYSKQALQDWWKPLKPLAEVVQSTRQMFTCIYLYSLSITLYLMCSARLHPDGQPLLKCELCVLTAPLQPTPPISNQIVSRIAGASEIYIHVILGLAVRSPVLPYARCLLCSSLTAGLKVLETKFYKSGRVCVCETFIHLLNYGTKLNKALSVATVDAHAECLQRHGEGLRRDLC